MAIGICSRQPSSIQCQLQAATTSIQSGIYPPLASLSSFSEWTYHFERGSTVWPSHCLTYSGYTTSWTTEDLGSIPETDNRCFSSPKGRPHLQTHPASYPLLTKCASSWPKDGRRMKLNSYLHTFHSFSSLSYNRSKASSKASSSHSAIQSFLLQMRVSSPFLNL